MRKKPYAVYPVRLSSRKRIREVPKGKILETKARHAIPSKIRKFSDLSNPEDRSTGNKNHLVNYYKQGIFGKVSKTTGEKRSLFKIAVHLEQRGLGKFLLVFAERETGEMLSIEAKGTDYLKLISTNRGKEKRKLLREIGMVDGEFHRKGVMAGQNENEMRLQNYIRTKKGIKFVDIDEKLVLITTGISLKNRIKYMGTLLKFLINPIFCSQLIGVRDFRSYVEGYIIGYLGIPVQKKISKMQRERLRKILDLYYKKALEYFGDMQKKEKIK